VSSLCGSADLLFELGFPEKLSSAQASWLLEKTGFTFFFAPNFHPSMKHVMPVRKSLGFPTIFNLLGPLANPISPEVQLLGVGKKEYLRPMALALSELGIKSALVVHSQDGFDEISPCAITEGFSVKSGSLQDFSFDPQKHGISGRVDDLIGGDAKKNASMLQNMLDAEKSTVYHAVCLNAGAILWICGKTNSLIEGYEQAKLSIDQGQAKKFLATWISESKNIPHSAP
jgi:anthranilate phosphoribosyltransferase